MWVDILPVIYLDFQETKITKLCLICAGMFYCNEGQIKGNPDLGKDFEIFNQCLVPGTRHFY